MLSDVCLSVTYIGPKSRTERRRKTKIGTEVGHVTRDSDTTFKVKRSRSRRWGILWGPPAQLVEVRWLEGQSMVVTNWQSLNGVAKYVFR